MKSNLTKAKEISQDTKREVLERQNGKSISGVFLSQGKTEFHHVILRSAGGVGYEWNIVAITSEEHRAYHDKQTIKVYGRDRYSWQEFETLMKNHLKLNYNRWSEDKCRYHKYWSEEDYEIKRYSQKKPY